MITQTTRGRVKPAWALMAIAGSVLGLYALDALLALVVKRGLLSTLAASVVLWAAAILLFLGLFWRFCLCCVYQLDGVKLCLHRVYVKNPRLIETVLLREVVYFGSPAGAKRYGSVFPARFTSRYSGFPPPALVYRREGKYKTLLFDPNEEIKARLRELLPKKSEE